MGTNLVTRAEYKAYANITSTTQDTPIDAIIPKVSQLVKSICRRTFVDYIDDAKVEVFNGGEYISPGEYPVLNISSLEYSNDYGATYTDLVEYTDFVLDIEDQMIRPLASSGLFDRKTNAYRLTYTAGFEELPADLKIAVLDLVSYYLKNDMSIHSPKAPGTNSVQVEYVTTTNLPAHIKRILDLYAANYN